MRLAWFSPFPPVRTGIAACSADLVPALAARHHVDCFVDEPLARSGGEVAAVPLRSAHEFVWRHRRQPYDLTVYQFGNSSHHDYLWAYLFRYPGLAVLHDAHLHHARAAALLRTRRADDYRAEVAACHPDVSPDLAELAVAGFDTHLYYSMPMTRLVVRASRLTAVHTRPLATRLRDENPGSRVEAIRLGHGTPIARGAAAEARARTRARYGVPDEALLFGVFGALTPEKRLRPILDACAALHPTLPAMQLLLAGPPAAHYDVAAEVAARGLERAVTITGYLESDADLTDAIAACDAALTLRWPTAREVSGPWLRALAAGVPTVTLALAHTWDVPALDPRSWQPSVPGRAPVTIAIDILDEDHSLRVAMRRLATDPALRDQLADAGRQYWAEEHSIDGMIADYERLLPLAAQSPRPRPELPPHLVTHGGETLGHIAAEFGVGARVWSKI